MIKSVTALSVVLLLAACGSGDDETAARNLRSEIVANSSLTSAASISEEQADCVADGMVERIGVEDLRGYEILTEDLKVNQGIEDVQLSSRDADALADVFLGCIDVQALLEKQLTATSTAAALTSAQQECIADTVTDDVVRKILVAGFRGEKTGYTALQEQMMDCALRAE